MTEYILPDSGEAGVLVKVEEDFDNVTEDNDDLEELANRRLKEEELYPDDQSNSSSSAEEKFDCSSTKQEFSEEISSTTKKEKRGRPRKDGRKEPSPYYNYTPHICEICNGRKFIKTSSYISHLNLHERIKEREGEDRPIRRNKRGRLANKKPVTEEEEIEIECEICPGRKFNKKAWTEHLHHHRMIREKEGKDRSILTQEQFQQLKKAKRNEFAGIGDGEEKELKCSICSDRVFDTEKRYIAHLHQHKEIRRKEGQDRPIGPCIIVKRKKGIKKSKRYK